MCDKTGVVFDVKEFAVYDGPGIRTTVFMKGCPLRCQWCHNPEGLSPKPQLMVSPSACTHCGACTHVCKHPDGCIACGDCVPVCKAGLRRIAGKAWTSSDLAARLLRDRAVLEASGGGVTFSGGEPLMQWPFVAQTVEKLNGLHTCIETSGFSSDDVFEDMLQHMSMVMMDIKLVNAQAHKRWTGVDNACILRHVQRLCRGDMPFIIRMPLIPGVNDCPAHFSAVADLLKGAKNLIRVELLPYHQTAGAKYPLAGMQYRIDFDPSQPVQLYPAPLDTAGIPWKKL